MRKELPLAEPPKKSHLFYALPLAVIMNTEDMWNWYYSEFIQMFTFRVGGNRELLLYNYGVTDEYEPLEILRANRYPLRLNEDLIKLYCMFIDNGYYPYMLCDDFHISTMDIKIHRLHDIMIYGYDDIAKTFMAYAYNGAQLQKFNISYEDVLKAYYSNDIDETFQLTQFYRKSDKKYKLEFEKIKWHLLDYYEGVSTMERERPYSWQKPYSVWGMKIYNELIDKYKYFKEKNEQVITSNIYCLYEHKRDMVNRIKYLANHSPFECTNEILVDFEKIMKEASLLVNLNIKLNLKIDSSKNAEQDFLSIMSGLDKVHKLEKKAFEKYLNYNEKVITWI